MTKKNGKRKLETEDQSVVDWDEENVFPDEVMNEIETMWEIPQVFHFLHLTKDALNIPHLSMYEMERMLLIPRASKQLANIMTSLLSSPITKAKFRKVPPMPYEFWTNILAHKVEGWFKFYEVKHRNAVKVLESIGVEPDFWNVFPQPPLVDGKDFEELSVKQKVWLLKTICDTVMHTKKTVQEKLFEQPIEDQIETVLGTDRYGARYIYFPQFLKSDLRIYKHTMDNKILSTAKPIQPKLNTSFNNNDKQANKLTKKKLKCRRRRSRWSNGLLSRAKRSVNKCDDKRSLDSKYGSDSATGSLTNDDTNLSSISTSSNNNHIDFHTINRKRSRSLSKTSEVSSTSVETLYRSVRSSGYDTNSSTDTDTDGKVTQKVFKGFADTSTSKYKIEIISGILNELKSEVDEDEILEHEVSSTNSSQENMESISTKQYLNAAISRTEESAERPSESLSSSSKTDDEKLNEIISAEGTKLNRINTNRFPVKENLQPHCLISKSDDEKLSENRTNSNLVKEENKDNLRDNENDCGDTNSTSIKKEKLTPEKVVEYMEVTDSTKERQSKLETSNDKDIEQLQNEKTCSKKDIKDQIFLSNKPCSFETQDDIDMESSDEDDSSLIALRCQLQREAMDTNFGWHDNVEMGHNFRRTKDEETTEWKKYLTNFNELLLELSVSKFQLVSDSVESLRGLICSFTTKSENPGTSSNNDMPLPLCEEKLAVKLKELLSTVEGIEPRLKDSMRKARGRLQRDWTNFKQGSVEDQDSSGEGGLNSNWWVLGSQGCPRPTNGDSTLQTISQSTLSPLGTESHRHKCEDQQEAQAKNTEENQFRKQESTEEQRENAEGKDRRKNEAEEEEEPNKQTTSPTENTDEEYNKEEEQQSRRVLRARGVSSYTEQFSSDDEIEENGMEEWTDIEAVYATPCAQANTPSAHSTPKIKHPDDRTEQEDSDQDWILPGSRKRKNKRPSANRRLKSFQHKLQNMITDAVQDAVQEAVDLGRPIPDNMNVNKDTPICTESKTPPKNVQNERLTPDSSTERNKVKEDHCSSEIVPSTQSIYKVEPVDSVHSELDIKDEGPIYDSAPNQLENNYGINIPQNYLMVKADNNPVNYYVMQPNLGPSVVQPNTIVHSNPVLSNIIPSIQPGYYVQGTPNYFISNSQPNFVPPPAALQPQGLQMISPQFVSPPHGYIPNVMGAPQTHPGYMTMQVPRGQSVYQEMPPNSPTQNQTARTPIRYSQNRYQQPRQNYPHPNGAAIKSNMSVRGNLRRQLNVKSTTRNSTPRQRVGAPTVQNLRQNTPSNNATQKTTSLIVLSDSDDEIEMIITEAATPHNEENKVKSSTHRTDIHTKRKQTTTIIDTESPQKSVIPPQIIERMNQGGISITPVKSTPAQNSNTQLVVVVNETGSHYAIALPNGSKLILTPEQVAQIRASNGGKLVL